MRSPTTAGEEKPAPRPFAFQSNLGPPAGHSFNRPVSGETPVRSAPRQPGQSAATAADVARPPSIRHHPYKRFKVMAWLQNLRASRRKTSPPPAADGTGRLPSRRPQTVQHGRLEPGRVVQVP